MGQLVRCIVVLLMALSVTNTLAQRILGGIEVVPYTIKFQASVRYGGWNHYCGATLIKPQWLISAAHCWIPPFLMRVVLLEHNLREDEGFEQVFNVSEIFVHPRFVYRYFDNDIMLIKLSKPAQLTADSYAKLPDGNTPRLSPYTTCTVSGWGVTNVYNRYLSPVLRAAEVQIFPYCNYYYGWRITNNMLCAGSRYGGKDSCKGDSGGPLICNGYFTGIVSWGFGCGYAYYPGVYTKVSNYVRWIKRVMRNNST